MSLYLHLGFMKERTYVYKVIVNISHDTLSNHFKTLNSIIAKVERFLHDHNYVIIMIDKNLNIVVSKRI